MDYPLKRKFGYQYQQKSEQGLQNEVHIVRDIAVVKSLTNSVCFLTDLTVWNRLPWGGWIVDSNGYASNCGVKLHRLVAWLTGMIDESTDPAICIDHKNRNRLDCRICNLRTCTQIQNGWNVEKRHGHQLKNGKWKFTFSKSFQTEAEAEDGIRNEGFQYMNSNRTCFMSETFDTYQEGYEWWRFQAGLHYGEFSPFANPYQTCEEIVQESQSGSYQDGHAPYTM